MPDNKEVMFTMVNRKTGKFDPVVIGYSSKHQSNWFGAVKKHLNNWEDLLGFMVDSNCLEVVAVITSYMKHNCIYDDIHIHTEWNIPTDEFSPMLETKDKRVHFDRYVKLSELETNA